MVALPTIALGHYLRDHGSHDDRSRYPMWNLFCRLVSGETDLAEQFERRSVRGLVRALGG